jgi:hypothetical protein
MLSYAFTVPMGAHHAILTPYLYWERADFDELASMAHYNFIYSGLNFRPLDALVLKFEFSVVLHYKDDDVGNVYQASLQSAVSF